MSELRYIIAVCVLVLGAWGLGYFAGSVMSSVPEPIDDDETPSVSCSTFIANGSAAGYCFVTGDVSFRWIGDNSTNDTVRLDGNVANGSHVWREP